MQTYLDILPITDFVRNTERFRQTIEDDSKDLYDAPIVLTNRGDAEIVLLHHERIGRCQLQDLAGFCTVSEFKSDVPRYVGLLKEKTDAPLLLTLNGEPEYAVTTYADFRVLAKTEDMERLFKRIRRSFAIPKEKCVDGIQVLKALFASIEESEHIDITAELPGWSFLMTAHARHDWSAQRQLCDITFDVLEEDDGMGAERFLEEFAKVMDSLAEPNERFYLGETSITQKERPDYVDRALRSMNRLEMDRPVPPVWTEQVLSAIFDGHNLVFCKAERACPIVTYICNDEETRLLREADDRLWAKFIPVGKKNDR